MPTTGAGWIALGSVAAASATVYTAVEQSRATKKAESEAKKIRAQQAEQFGRELEAGEYFQELGRQQMELQTQSSNIKTLANLIQAKSQPPAQQILTLPPATEYGAATQINQAIDKLFRR